MGAPSVMDKLAESIGKLGLNDSVKELDLKGRHVCRACWVMFPSKKKLQDHKRSSEHNKTDSAVKAEVAATAAELKKARESGSTHAKLVAQWNVDVARAGKRGEKGVRAMDLILSKLFKEADATRSSGRKKKQDLQKKSHGVVCCGCMVMFESKKSLIEHIDDDVIPCKTKPQELAERVKTAKQTKKDKAEQNLEAKKENKDADSLCEEWNLRLAKTRRAMLELLFTNRAKKAKKDAAVI